MVAVRVTVTSLAPPPIGNAEPAVMVAHLLVRGSVRTALITEPVVITTPTPAGSGVPPTTVVVDRSARELAHA